jgi:hypothetical protein
LLTQIGSHLSFQERVKIDAVVLLFDCVKSNLKLPILVCEFNNKFKGLDAMSKLCKSTGFCQFEKLESSQLGAKCL